MTMIAIFYVHNIVTLSFQFYGRFYFFLSFFVLEKHKFIINHSVTLALLKKKLETPPPTTTKISYEFDKI